jgi:hypothetical protein
VKLWKPKTIWSAIVAALGAVGVLLGVILSVRQLLPKPTTPKVSVAFVLDVSPAMYRRFENTTKLAAAEAAIKDIIRKSHDVPTALRLAGGVCNEEYHGPTIDFASNNADRYAKFFGKLRLRPGPRPDYASSLAWAVDDLHSKERIKDSASKSGGVSRRHEGMPYHWRRSVYHWRRSVGSGHHGPHFRPRSCPESCRSREEGTIGAGLYSRHAPRQR